MTAIIIFGHTGVRWPGGSEIIQYEQHFGAVVVLEFGTCAIKYQPNYSNVFSSVGIQNPEDDGFFAKLQTRFAMTAAHLHLYCECNTSEDKHVGKRYRIHTYTLFLWFNVNVACNRINKYIDKGDREIELRCCTFRSGIQCETHNDECASTTEWLTLKVYTTNMMDDQCHCDKMRQCSRLTRLFRPTVLAMLPEGFPNTWYQVTLNQGLGTARREIWSMRFDRRDLLSLAASLSVGLCYFVTKHWATSDVLAASLALRGVELLPLCSIPAACLLFACLCLHDITSCQELSGLEGNIPIALVFPKELFGDGVDVSPFVIVPLDTVVIPGIFIAFLLKFDISIERNSRVYFYTGLTSYAAGLCLTAVLEHYALPIFPYLAPVYLGLPLLVAAYRAELTEMFCFVSAVERSPHTPQASELPLMPGYPAALGAFMSCKPRLYHIADPSSV
ncbi:signal peptide peptidase-like isoform X2 [Petromyzon marinus]|uniref:signal peptide peptidase-like isoform X2 n=1 Tax=Petromyzon marinus TaxID=7757 RepID=UPI003F6E78C4